MDAETIETAATEPAEVSVDGQTVKAQSLESLIEADRYLVAKTAVDNPRRGLRFNQLVPPGT